MKAKNIIIGILAALMLPSCASANQTEKEDGLIIYEAPSFSSKQVGLLKNNEAAVILEMGQEVMVDGLESIWVKVRMKDDTEGWGVANKPKPDDEMEMNMNCYFVVFRKGSKVTVTNRGQDSNDDEWNDLKDPSSVLASFFVSYFSQTEEWKDLVSESGIFGGKEDLIAVMEEAYEEFYGRVDSIQITIDPSDFMYRGNGGAYYRVNIIYSYDGEVEAGYDEVTMVQDENGRWFVSELPM